MRMSYFFCSRVAPRAIHMTPLQGWFYWFYLFPGLHPRLSIWRPFRATHMTPLQGFTNNKIVTCAAKQSHVSRLTSHVSRLTSHVSRLTSHVSRLTSHVSRLTSHVSLLTSQRLHRVNHPRLYCLVRNGYPCNEKRCQYSHHKYARMNVYLVGKILQPVVHDKIPEWRSN